MKSARGFTLIELLVAVSLMAVLGAVGVLAVRGFAGVGTSSRCGADTTRLRKAETTYFLVHDTYGDESQLVAAGLLVGPSELHDVTLAGSAYAITEVGPCIGQGSVYGIAAPTVGTVAHSGTTVSVLAPDGTGLSGVAASYETSGQSTWTTMGSTGANGNVTAALADGVYDIRITYAGAVNMLSQVTVTNGTLVTFPAVPLTVRLRDGNGVGQAGGTVVIQASGGAPVALGTTPASGDLVTEVLPGGYDITLAYGSMSSTHTAVTVTEPTVDTFELCHTVVRLRSASGGPMAGGMATATPAGGGSVMWLGITNPAGTVTATLLDGTYTVNMQYAAFTSTQSVAVSGAPTITFQFVTAAVHLAQSSGAPLTGGDAAAWYRLAGTSAWLPIGAVDASGNASIDVLPGTYDFAGQWFGVSAARTGVAVNAPTTVTLQTSLVTLRMLSSTGAPLSGQDAALFMRDTGASTWTLAGIPGVGGSVASELFPGSYDFEARWYGVTSVQSNVATGTNTTVTFHTSPATVSLVSSTGAGLTGQDGAFFARVSPSGAWFLAGPPDGSGSVAAELFPATYDFEVRWFNALSVTSAVPVTTGAPPTVTFHTTRATLRLLASTGAGLTGHDGAFFVRPGGTTPWMLSGYPDAAGTVQQELLAGTYDIDARWFGADSVQSSVTVVTGTPVTYTFSTKLTTLRMLSSTGTGLAGQDESMWVRTTGTLNWFQTDAPSGGAVAQELFAGTYDVRARWFGVFVQQSSVAVNGSASVTFTAVPVTLRMLTSGGSGLTGEDEAMWVRQTGTTGYFFLGPPPASGVLVQELFAATYDAKFRWTGSFTTLASNAVSGPTTVTVNAVPVVETCRRQSDGTAVAGATGSVVNSGVVYPFGTTNASGVVNLQVLTGAHDFRCKLVTLQGTNTNVNIPAGGGSTTVNMS